MFRASEVRSDNKAPFVLARINSIPPEHGYHADLSPDGIHIAYSACGYDNAGYEIAIANMQSGERWLLTANRHLDHYPVWSPDGKRIAFISEADGYGELALYTMASDGSDLRRMAGGAVLAPPVWSPDGERIAYIVGLDSSLYLYTIRADGTSAAQIAEASYVIRPPYHDEFAPSVPAWSPDGQYLAFIGGNLVTAKSRYNSLVFEAADAAIYTVRADGSQLRQVLLLKPHGPLQNSSRSALAGGDFYPYFPKISQVLWSPDGMELLFFANGAHLIDVEGGNLRRLSPPVLDGVAAWSPDGSRIAIYEIGNAKTPQDIWTASGHFRTLENDVGEMVLFTVARDGSDLQTLMEDSDEEAFSFSVKVPPEKTSTDLTVCAGGTVVPEPTANPGLVADCEALLLSRDILSIALKFRWKSDTPISEWEGVALGGEPLRVQELKLERMNGVLPPALGQLSELRRLEIRGVGSKESRHIGFRLSGGIPPELGNLQNLEVLDLSGNFLTGFIPAEFGDLAQLQSLWLEDNFLSGSIPPALSELKNLRSLNLAHNNLHGEIPPALSGLTQLQELLLQSNQLTGTIPSGLGSLSQLERLSLSVNRLSGEIPPALGALANLSHLSLEDNRLSGAIPPELGYLSQLVNLDFTNNRLDGAIPPTLGNLSQLKRLSLSYNQLAGSIPTELSNLSESLRLYLSDNELSGCVAAALPDIWVKASGLERCA